MTKARLPAVLAYCRAGYEAECGAELLSFARTSGLDGELAAVPLSAHVVLRLAVPLAQAALEKVFRLHRLIFARQVVFVAGHLPDMLPKDRAGPIAVAAAALGQPLADLWLETADTNDAKELSGLCRRLTGLLQAELETAQILQSTAANRLHVFFISGTEVLLGVSSVAHSSPWPMGIPRLRMPREAPSRSTLKLAEAFGTLLDDDERDRLIKPGMRAVDLGAAPGGWSWQAAQRGLHVVAVDNGPMAPAVLATGLVEHLRADGFIWRPRRPVDWLFCDMVAKPARVAALVADWLARGAARRAIFNLKLPMKKRIEAIEQCRAAMEQAGRKAGVPIALRFKHLYHDRDEITGYANR